MNLQYHIYEPGIKCPYCDEECNDDDYQVAAKFNSKVDFECDHCGKTFFAVAEVVYSTYSNCKLNDEEHDFKVSPTHSTVFNCKKCTEYEVR